MTSSYWKTTLPLGRREQVTWPSPAQMLRQLAIIVLIGAVWGALFVGYLRLTGGSAQAAAPAPTGQGAPVSFAKDVLPIFQHRCVQCHSGKTPAAGLSLTSYAGVMQGVAGSPVITPGKASDSILVQLVASGGMPKGLARLLPAQIQTISAWVEAGASNN